jgi:hypothetical protein
MQMLTRNARSTFAVVGILVLSGCASSQATARAVTGSTHYVGSQFAFTYPAQWSHYEYSAESSFSSAIVFLSTGRLHDPCTRTASTTACGWPVDRLGIGGVLVEWSANAFPLWTLAAERGTSTTIAGRPAKVRTESPGRCASLGAQVTVTAFIERALNSYNWYQMLACVNGPNEGVAERQLMSMLATVRLIQP